MEDDQGEDLTPFWLQTTADLRRGDRLRRSVSAVLFSSGLVVFLLLAIAVAFLLFLLPSTLSFTAAHVFRPNGVKKSWDSINIVLVLVAVVFGFLSRNRNEERYSDTEFPAVSGKQFEAEKSNPSTPSKWYPQKSEVASSSPRQWYEFPGFHDRSEGRSSVFLRRNSSSYPDLREFSSLNWSHGDYHMRVFDDSNVDPGRIRMQAPDMDLDPGRTHRRHRSMEDVESLRAPPQTKTVVVDTLLSKTKEAAELPPKENRRVMNQTAAVPRKERSRRRSSKDSGSVPPPPDAKSPPPPPPPPPRKSERKRGGATGNAFLNSLYHKKKTKQRLKRVDNLDSLHHIPQPPAIFQIPPPPAPPPPPPSVLHNLFLLKKQKRKRTIKVPVVLPATNPNPQIAPSPATQTPSKSINLHTLDEASNSSGESPLHRAPPPPPPPPPPFFKTTPTWRFVVQGDYVRVNSITSSRSGSPDPDELDSDVTPSSAGGDTTPFHPSPLFCPSPDVDTKAESFITSFRAKLKLEKAHSMKKSEPGLSTLGPRQI